MLKPQIQVLSFRVQVPAATLPSAPVPLKLSPQNPILKGLKLIYSPSTVLMQDVGFKVETSGLRIIPAIGSNEDSNFAGTPGYASITGLAILDLPEINQQIPGAPYDLTFKFINANAAAVYVSGWVFISPKIELPNIPIQEDSTKKKES